MDSVGKRESMVSYEHTSSKLLLEQQSMQSWGRKTQRKKRTNHGPPTTPTGGENQAAN
jgi:hypothetical protein